MVYADDVNMLGGSVHTIYKNTETLVFDSEAIGLEVNADKTKQKAGRSHNIKIDISSFERVEQFK